MDRQENKEMVLVDIRMPFWSMVFFMTKWAIATIPAIIILSVWLTLLPLLAGLLGAGGQR
jgi:hypothetical protein